MNEDKYKKADQIIERLNIWHDDKLLLKSVVARARKLENDVFKMHKEHEEIESASDVIGESFLILEGE